MSNVDWSKAPEGATHWERESYGVSAGWMRNDGGEWFFLSSGGHWLKHMIGKVSAVRLENMVKRPSPAWNGEGLPPVGTVCEAFYMGSPQGVVTVRYSGECMILWSDDRQSEQCGCAEHYIFRPIRTPEQIAAEERERAIKEMWSVYWQPHAATAMEGLGLLYDAGYRKQEQPE